MVQILKTNKLKKILTITLLLFFIIGGCNNSDEGSDKLINDDSIIDLDAQQPPNKQEINKESQLPDNEAGKNKALLQTDEKLIFSFKTDKGKMMNLVIQKNDKYIAYRFGAEDKVELQFPEKLESTFGQFTYHYYQRGGGASNEGLDLNYLSFSGDTHQFIIYEEHSFGDSDEEQLDIGIRIVDLKTKKETKIKGLSSSVKGSLVDFRFNDLVKVEEGEI